MIAKEGKNNISIRSLISVVFMSFLIMTSALTGYIAFANWTKSTDELTVDLARNLNEDIFSRVDDFLTVPLHLSSVNGKFLEMNTFDITNPTERERFFVAVLETHPEFINSFNYAMETGEMYGARRRNDQVEILRLNESTGGFAMYYEVLDDYSAGELIIQAGRDDPKMSEWYMAGKESSSSVFSPINKHIILDELTITAAYPIFDITNDFKGVLGTNIFLASIDKFLVSIVKENSGFAMIFEKDTGELISSSLEMNVIRTLDGGITRRISINESKRNVAIEAYNQHLQTQEMQFLFKNSDSQNYYLNVDEYVQNGIDWIIISALPKNILTAGISDNIWTAFFLILGMTIFVLILYYLLLKKYLKPLVHFETTAKRFSEGDFSERIPFVRNDEIGKISIAFNNMADQVSNMINSLEGAVEERTSQLKSTSDSLKESQDKLRLILDSAAESIYGVDLNGNCTFCNKSCIELLGYDSENDLLGEKMHDKIHHSLLDGNKLDISECSIHKAIISGKGVSVKDDVFWKADGTHMFVDYSSFPQFIDGKIVGAVISFVDNTIRKENEERIRFSRCHDSLTGLLNRDCFQENLPNLDKDINLPISVIFGDVTGLKLTNDIFGHNAGDELIVSSANALIKASRPGDIIARIGGDEFVMVMPKTSSGHAKNVLKSIKMNFTSNKSEVIKSKMPLGLDTKYSVSQNIQNIIDSAENKMYKEKVMDRKSTQSKLIESIIDTLHKKSQREKIHSENVSLLCRDIANTLGLSQSQVNKIERAGYLHDIGKIILDNDLLNKSGLDFTKQDERNMQQHSIVGFRILNLFDKTLDLADAIYSHHEYWDGSGYPKGLKGEEIPLMARIITVAERYDARTNKTYGKNHTKDEAIEEIKRLAGIKFDPQVVDAFINTMRS